MKILPDVEIHAPSKVEYRYEYTIEDMPLEDIFDDEKTIENISKRLLKGDGFAWFEVEVRACWGEIESEPVYLGGCSYDNENDFLGSVTAEDLRREALYRLRESVAEIRKLTSLFILHVDSKSC